MADLISQAWRTPILEMTFLQVAIVVLSLAFFAVACAFVQAVVAGVGEGFAEARKKRP